MKKENKDLEVVEKNQGIEFQLMQQAIEGKASIETIERLVALMEKGQANFARKEYFKAMANFQSQCPIIEKTKKVENNNGKELYRYASLDKIISQKNDDKKDVKYLIKENGFSYSFRSDFGENPSVSCIVSHIEGHKEEYPILIKASSNPLMNEAQKNGSATTYAKRYAFCNAFGIMTGDEDNDTDDLNGDSKADSRAEEIEAIKTLPALKKYLDKNKGKGREFDGLIVAKHKALSEAQKPPVSDDKPKDNKSTAKTPEQVKKWISTATDEKKLEELKDKLEKGDMYSTEITEELLIAISDRVIDLDLEEGFETGEIVGDDKEGK